jgi:hypothetical protein
MESLRDGLKKLRLGLITASGMLTPHLQALETGRRPPKIEGLPPSVKHIAQITMISEGWKGKTESSFKSKVWGPIRPVAHLAFAFSQLAHIDRRAKASEWGRNSMKEMLSPFPDDDMIIEIIERAETIRLLLPKLGQFRFSEERTIRFVAKKVAFSVLISQAESRVVE